MTQGNGPRRISVPGEMRIALAIHDSPSAAPAIVLVHKQEQVHCHQFGGLTKVEHVAAQLFAALLAQQQSHEPLLINDTLAAEHTARACVGAARLLLAACNESPPAVAESPHA